MIWLQEKHKIENKQKNNTPLTLQEHHIHNNSESLVDP